MNVNLLEGLCVSNEYQFSVNSAMNLDLKFLFILIQVLFVEGAEIQIRFCMLNLKPRGALWNPNKVCCINGKTLQSWRKNPPEGLGKHNKQSLESNFL